MSTFTNLSSEQLRRAADLKEKISALELELAALLGGTNGVTVVRRGPGRPKGRKMSAAGIARIKAAQKLRWAKVRAVQPAADVAPKKKKFTMSAAAKAKISAAAKARWAKAKAAK